MLFIGESEAGYFINEISKELGLNYTNIQVSNSIRNQINDILSHGEQDFTIFDISQYHDETDVIVGVIDSVRKVNQSKIIIYAISNTISTELIQALRAVDIKLFITAKNTSSMKDQFYKCINGYYEHEDNPDIVNLTNTISEYQKEKKAIKIGIMGVCERIGCTTYALQLVKHLQSYGYKCSYVQMNTSSYLDTIKQFFSGSEYLEDYKRLTYSGIEHYYNSSFIDDLAFSYDYIIYDYGNIKAPGFNREAFLSMHERVAIVGSDPSEFVATLQLIKNPFYDKIKYVFNFASDSEIEDLNSLMKSEGKEQDSFISTLYIPDKYSYTESKLFSVLIPAENLNPPVETNQSLFEKLNTSFLKPRKTEKMERVTV